MEDKLEGEEPPPYFTIDQDMSSEDLVSLYKEVMDSACKIFAPFGFPRMLTKFMPLELLLERYSPLLEAVSSSVDQDWWW